jgi:hypothetical protein
MVSTPLFIAVLAISVSDQGKTAKGAKLNFGLWGAGLLVEIVSHIRMSRHSWHRYSFLKSRNPAQVEGTLDETMVKPPELPGQSSGHTYQTTLPVPQSDFSLSSRLEAITTIILGEVSQQAEGY